MYNNRFLTVLRSYKKLPLPPPSVYDCCCFQLHLAKLSKETIELTRGDDLKNILHRSEQREQQLNTMIETLENRHRMCQCFTQLVEKLHEKFWFILNLAYFCRHIKEFIELCRSQIYKMDVCIIEESHFSVELVNV